MTELSVRGPARPQGYFERLRELFDRFAEMPPSERDAQIGDATEGDAALEAELRALLEYVDRAETPLDDPLLATWDDLPLPQIDGYHLQRRIGRGGSATVYLADQEHPDFTRAVALKVIDCVVDPMSARRVREEQRILARLEHAGIARLYNTGVTSLGQPYLAMEHVQGTTIVDYCRTGDLSVRARIELFLSVLDAVRYAHEQGIVHRDLKPGNILVSSRGDAKLLDFGIAKLTARDDDPTVTLNRAMTPAYASPEQIFGGRITQASDVYSLGLVLYELLAGTPPSRLDWRLFADIEEAQRVPDPEPPSAAFAVSAMSRADAAQWRNTLRGDLDAIVLKTLRQKPEERYASAAELAGDLRAFLNGRPVVARRSELLRVVRWIRRHRVGVTGVAALLILAASAVAFNAQRRATANHSAEIAVFFGDRALRDAAEKLARFDAAAARDQFRAATTTLHGRLPEEALAWDGVARANRELGEIGRSADAARRAADLLANDSVVPRDELERMRAAAQIARHDWSPAIATLDALFGREPERVDVGLALVSALLAAGRTDAADTALGRLRQLQTNNDDPRIDLIDAEVAQQLCEFQRAVAAADRARARAARVNATALVLRAERVHAEAIGRLDRREEARRALQSLVKRDTAAGLPGEAAASQLALGAVLLRIGTNDETREVLEKAFQGLHASGNERGEISARSLLATQAGKRGELAPAVESINVAVADAKRIGDRWAEGNALSQRLVLLNWSDDEAGVDAAIAPTLAALRDSGNRQVLMTTLANLAIAAIERLDLDGAEAYLEEADALGRRVGSQLARASVDRSRGYLAQTRGDLDLARGRYAAALDKATNAGVPLAKGNYLSDLAWLELAADRPDAAAARGKEAIEALTAGGDTRGATEIEAVLAWADACHGDVDAAKHRLVLLRDAAAKSGSDYARFMSIIAEARVASVTKDWRRAIALRREALRGATAWKTQGLIIEQQFHLAVALHDGGQRREFDELTAHLLPELDRLGLRGLARELRAL